MRRKMLVLWKWFAMGDLLQHQCCSELSLWACWCCRNSRYKPFTDCSSHACLSRAADVEALLETEIKPLLTLLLETRSVSEAPLPPCPCNLCTLVFPLSQAEVIVLFCSLRNALQKSRNRLKWFVESFANWANYLFIIKKMKAPILLPKNSLNKFSPRKISHTRL